MLHKPTGEICLVAHFKRHATGARTPEPPCIVCSCGAYVRPEDTGHFDAPTSSGAVVAMPVTQR